METTKRSWLHFLQPKFSFNTRKAHLGLGSSAGGWEDLSSRCLGMERSGGQCCTSCFLFSADECGEERSRVRQPSGHPAQVGRGDSGEEGAGDGGPQWGRSLSGQTGRAGCQENDKLQNVTDTMWWPGMRSGWWRDEFRPGEWVLNIRCLWYHNVQHLFCTNI